MTSHEIGDIVFVPFWVVFESLDATPPNPFLKCTILSVGTTPDDQVEICDLNLGKPGLIAPGVVTKHLIKPSQLGEWAKIIADWFIDYAEKEK